MDPPLPRTLEGTHNKWPMVLSFPGDLPTFLTITLWTSSFYFLIIFLLALTCLGFCNQKWEESMGDDQPWLKVPTILTSKFSSGFYEIIGDLLFRRSNFLLLERGGYDQVLHSIYYPWFREQVFRCSDTFRLQLHWRKQRVRMWWRRRELDVIGQWWPRDQA